MLRVVAFCVLCLSTAATAYGERRDIEQTPGHSDALEARITTPEGESTALPYERTDRSHNSGGSAQEVVGAIAENIGAPDAGLPPSHGTEWLGFWANAYEYADLEAWLGRPVRIAHFKLPFGHNGFAQALDEKQKKWLEDFTTLVPHAQLTFILDIFPTRGNDPRFSEVAIGRWDLELRQVARRIIDSGHEDAILRLWHEPEVAVKNHAPIGPTWCDDPAFIPAWRRVHDLFEAEAGAAFSWQYSVNGPAGSQKRSADGAFWIDKCYPGNAYVDQVSVGAYHRVSRTPSLSWRQSLNKLEFVRDWAFARGHIFSVAEWGLWSSDCRWSGHDDDPSFIQRSYDFFATIPAEKRGYMLYFNRMECVDLKRFPESRALFAKLFGG